MLKQDKRHRGENAVHVHWHQKLGRHKTIIKGTLLLVNLLLASRRVIQVNLGQMRSVWPPRQEQWLRVELLPGKKSGFKMVVMDGRAVQFFTVETETRKDAERFISTLPSGGFIPNELS